MAILVLVCACKSSARDSPPASSGSAAAGSAIAGSAVAGSAAPAPAGPPAIVARVHGGFAGVEVWKVGIWTDGTIRVEVEAKVHNGPRCTDELHTTPARVQDVIAGLRKLDFARAPAEMRCADAFITEVSFGENKGELLMRDDCAKDKLGLMGSAMALLRDTVGTTKCADVLTYQEPKR